MVEPIRRAAPLAIFRPTCLPEPSAFAAGAVLALPCGDVAADLRLQAVDRRRRVAVYELRIANETDNPLVGFAYPIEAGRRGGVVRWSTIPVPARTSVAVPVEVRLSPRRPILRVVAEIHGEGFHLTVDADPPKHVTSFRLGKAGLAAALLLGVLGSGAYALEPRIAALAASRAGVAPTAPNGRAAQAPAPHPPARTKAHLKVTLDADTLEGGKPIVVRYAPGVATGTVKLLDQDGTERASALLGKRGSSILLAPKVESAEDFRLVIDARRGTTRDETALPVRVLPATQNVTAVKPLPVKARVAALDVSPIALATTTYRSGQEILVSIVRYAPDLEVSLMDDTGAELRKVAVRPEDKELRVEAPSVGDDARFTIVATFARGSGQDSVIKPIIVRPW